MKVAFMFSGQGSQYLGMGQDLYEAYGTVRDVFDEANKTLGYNIKNIMFFDEKKLNDTKYTQVAMFVFYQAILEILKEYNIFSDYSLGLSLGEYGAYLHNEVFDFSSGLKVVQCRGEFMNLAASKNPGKMSAVLGLKPEILESLILRVNGYTTIANYNTYSQLVISGEAKAIDELSVLAKESGAKRVIPLKTSGAFHSKLMSQAAIDFENYLDSIEFQEPKRKLIVNVTGNYYKNNLKEMMVLQITNSVKFFQSIETLIKDGIDTFIEIGPKRTLCGLVKKINKDVKLLNIEDLISLQNTLTELEV